MKWDYEIMKTQDVQIRENLDKQVDAFSLGLEFGSTFKFGHTHLDNIGIGNQSENLRRLFIQTYVRMMRKARLEREAHGNIILLWLVIDLSDSQNDAVYYHSMVGQNEEPLNGASISWSIKVPELWDDIFPNEEFVVGGYEHWLYVLFRDDFDSIL